VFGPGGLPLFPEASLESIAAPPIEVLSSVLQGKRAIAMNIEVMRAGFRIREDEE
jgi:hypothetical protein